MTDTDRLLRELDARVKAAPGDAAAVYERGRLLWKLGQRGRAISDFNTAAALDPDGPGAAAAAHAMEIMDFFNPDLYNP